jgi:hypothetical protein
MVPNCNDCILKKTGHVSGDLGTGVFAFFLSPLQTNSTETDGHHCVPDTVLAPGDKKIKNK